MDEVRVRFAPSPTGFLHIGGARTALFNELYARQQGGTFLLRIEDTDVKRSSDEMVEGILQGLRWLGLEWDDDPVFQSQRMKHYRAVTDRLLAEGQAYRCFLTPQELEASRQEARKDGGDWRYDPRSREMDPQEARRRAEAGESHVVRMRVEAGRTIRFKDRVFGKIEVEGENIEDFVLLRSDGVPTYHLAVVADDTEMGITHVIRGVDHLINTAKHILIYIALGEKVPKYVHLPLILGPDGKRLSKRHGATSVTEYQSRGILPAALRNYLALLGWNPKSNQEIFSHEELIKHFKLSQINKADAVFDRQKLEWMNGQYISSLPVEELAPLVEDVLRRDGLWRHGTHSFAAGKRSGGRDKRGETAQDDGPERSGGQPASQERLREHPVQQLGIDENLEDESREPLAAQDRDDFLNAIRLLQPRMRSLDDFAIRGRPYFSDDFDYEPEAVEKFLPQDDRGPLIEALEDLRRRYSGLEPFDLQHTEEHLRAVCQERGLKAGKLIGAVRVGLTGQSVAPGIFDVIVHLGRQSVDRRLERLIEYLQ
ncbi:MAG TPA: glutamate--tRNA ligase [Acidobacteriota bacterium]|nr:glutamate--tRNA ligase [Acidobacteriota bacterium]